MAVPLILFLGLLSTALVYVLNARRELLGLKQAVRDAGVRMETAIQERDRLLRGLLGNPGAAAVADREALARLDAARAAVFGAARLGSGDELGEAEGALRQALERLDAAVRSPEPGWSAMRDALRQRDEAVARCRFRFNRRVQRANRRLTHLPDLLVARWCGVRGGQPVRPPRAQRSRPGLAAC